LFGKKPQVETGQSTQPVAGWYEEGAESGVLRYWNGNNWTEESMPITDATPQLLAEQAKVKEQALRQRTQVQAVELQQNEVNQKSNELIEKAKKYAQNGQIENEEIVIAQFLQVSKDYSGKAGFEGAQKFISQLVTRKELRIGCTYIGEVKKEGGISQYSRTNNFLSVQMGGQNAKIFSDRIFHGSKVYPIDKNTGAQVTLDGITQITQRPTLTRMALLSPLPGSALVPGLALQKKTQNDLRSATFIVASPKWSFTIPVSPDNISIPRQLAERINKIAQSMESSSSLQQSIVTHNPVVAQTKADQIEAIHKLLTGGALTQIEFDHLKSEIITGKGNP